MTVWQMIRLIPLLILACIVLPAWQSATARTSVMRSANRCIIAGSAATVVGLLTHRVLQKLSTTPKQLSRSEQCALILNVLREEFGGLRTIQGMCAHKPLSVACVAFVASLIAEISAASYQWVISPKSPNTLPGNRRSSGTKKPHASTFPDLTDTSDTSPSACTDPTDETLSLEEQIADDKLEVDGPAGILQSNPTVTAMLNRAQTQPLLFHEKLCAVVEEGATNEEWADEARDAETIIARNLAQDVAKERERLNQKEADDLRRKEETHKKNAIFAARQASQGLSPTPHLHNGSNLQNVAPIIGTADSLNIIEILKNRRQALNPNENNTNETWDD